MTKKRKYFKKNKKFLFFSASWFIIGFCFTAVFLTSFLFISIQFIYKNKSFEGVFVEKTYVGGKTKEEIKRIFDKKNSIVENSTFTFSYEDKNATVSAQKINIGYDSKLITEQAISIGKTRNTLTNFYIILDAYINGIYLPPSYTFSNEKLKEELGEIHEEIYSEPIEALFTVESNKVVAFKESADGKTIDYDSLNEILGERVKDITKSNKEQHFKINIPVKTLKPKMTTEEVNNLGIVEIVGQGISFFRGSIQNRIHNIGLAASKMNGILIAPGEVFSFNNTVGDISKDTGFKEAYVIQNGKTILGDGGGVCQVSTTLFRAAVNAGLPIKERYPHAYRVYYYEQDSFPGMDATVFHPNVDLKFKNDMKNHILIQTIVDYNNLSLTFLLYGKKDDRVVNISKPVITKQTSPPQPIYQDDSELPKDTIKQIEHEAPGANVYFTRTVTKNGEKPVQETFYSNYRPWAAVYLKGTKE